MICGMLSGCINCCSWTSFLLLSICCGFQFYANALIPVNNDGLGDYIRNAMTSSSVFQPWLSQQQRRSPQPTDMVTTAIPSKTVIRIQRTDEAQLSDIASFLATASRYTCRQQEGQKASSNPWRDRIDLLFAKSDIEALIRRRWRIIDMGRKAFVRAEKQIEQQQTIIDMKQQKHLTTTCKDRMPGDDAILKYVWSTNDELRNEIQIAASETGEDTIWKHHYPMIITPSSKHWFNHIQISAIASTITAQISPATKTTNNIFNFSVSFKDDEVIKKSLPNVAGFCEVAMLLNPIYSLNQTTHDCICPNGKTDCVISIQDRTTQQQQQIENKNTPPSPPKINYYTPAIANLAVDDTMRRQGIATKLLQRAERYVIRYWTNTTTIGLYVSTSNIPAIQLYEKCGYHKRLLVPPLSTLLLSSSWNYNDDEINRSSEERDGSMWYMSKQI